MRDRDDILVAVCLFATLFTVYLLTFSGTYHSSDEMSMLAATDSLARRGSWDIDLLRWMGEQQGSFGPDGHLYSRKGIGTTLAALPHYWFALHYESLGNVQAGMLTNSFVTALTAVLVFAYLRLLAYGRGTSLLTALAYGLATMAWPYARFLFSEPLAGLGLMLSAFFLLRYRQSSRARSLFPFLAGAGLGLALLSRLNNAIAAPLLGLLLLVYLYRCHRRALRAWIGPVILFAVPVIAALVISASYNWLRFGGPLITGYLPEERFATPFLEGLYGLTFSPGKGLFWYNPILFAALLAWPAFYRGTHERQTAEALLIAAVVVVNLAFYAPWYLWWAGHGWGPRFIVTIMPFAALPLAPALQAAQRWRPLALCIGFLFALSAAVQLLAVAVDFNLYLNDIYASLGLYHPATLFVPAYSALLRQLSYLDLENLDFAWARGASLDWIALTLSLVFVTLSLAALWAAWRNRLRTWMALAFLLLLPVATLVLLVRYAPTGDVARASHALAAMEDTDRTAVLTNPLLTAAFQDAYDGDMKVWGIRSKEELGEHLAAIWVIGEGAPQPAVARFQVGSVRLDHYAVPGRRFPDARLRASPFERQTTVNGLATLVATDIGAAELRKGSTLPVVLYWRVLAPTAASYTTYVQLIEETGSKAGQVDRLPCGGRCLTTTWRPDDLIGDWYALPISPAAAPGGYRLIAGMYDLETGENLSWTEPDGDIIGPNLVIGLVEIQP